MIVVASHRQTLPTLLVARMFLPPLSQLARLSRRIHSYSVVTLKDGRRISCLHFGRAHQHEQAPLQSNPAVSPCQIWIDVPP